MWDVHEKISTNETVKENFSHSHLIFSLVDNSIMHELPIIVFIEKDFFCWNSMKILNWKTCTQKKKLWKKKRKFKAKNPHTKHERNYELRVENWQMLAVRPSSIYFVFKLFCCSFSCFVYFTVKYVWKWTKLILLRIKKRIFRLQMSLNFLQITKSFRASNNSENERKFKGFCWWFFVCKFI